MLTADYLDVLPAPVIDIYERYQVSVIEDIARRLANLNYASAAWQVQRLNESAMLYDQILEKLSVLTGKSEKELHKIFQKAGVRAMRFDDAIYRMAGLSLSPLNQSPAMLGVLLAGLEKTNGILRNFTLTTAMTGQGAFIDAADLAYMQITTGAFDYNTAIKNAVKDVAKNGLTVINYDSGRQDRIDVAVRRTVLTGVNQTAGMLSEARADEMGTDLVQTSAHIGARNKGDVPENHEKWQGRVFSRTGNEYPNFYEITGYGTVTGLYGINCRHSHGPFFDGLSEIMYSEADLQSYANKSVSYNGQELDFFSATQKQRYIERGIRRWKREAAALKAAGLDNSFELSKVREWQGKMRDFIQQTDLNRDYVREQVFTN